jgi:hypothetical protein
MHPTWCMAEREGFEPSVPLLAEHTISSRAPSASSVISPQNFNLIGRRFPQIHADQKKDNSINSRKKLEPKCASVSVVILNSYPENLRLSASHDFVFWRRGWDSNPRESFWPPSRFRVDPVTTTSVPLRKYPFSHRGHREPRENEILIIELLAKVTSSAIPAKAGIQLFQDVLDPGFRRGDDSTDFLRDYQFGTSNLTLCVLCALCG